MTNAPTVLQQIPAIPPKPCAVGVHPARHPQNAEDVHREEDHVHSDEHQPEVPFAQALVQQPPRHLWEPVIEASQQTEDRAAEEDIVDMGYHVIGVGDLPIDGDGCHMDPDRCRQW